MSKVLIEESTKTAKLEKEVEQLQNNIKRVKNNEGFEEENDHLARVVLENTKLKHRLAILNKAISVENDQPVVEFTEMISITNHFTELFSIAISLAYPTLKNAPTVITPVTSNSKFGDYQCNSALPIAKLLSNKEMPRNIAGNIIKFVRKSFIIEKMEVANAGFINIFLQKKYAKVAIGSILKNGVKPPKVIKQRIIVDLSSPNIAKEMHVGHLRSTIIGDSISRLMEFFEHDVLRLNHVGDWGTQFGMLIAHLKDKFPNYLNVSPPISDLQSFYKESKKLFDEDEEFKKRAYANVVKLQSGDKDSLQAWNLICNVSRKEFQSLYDRLDVKLIERGESFYQSRMEDIVKELAKNNFLEEDEGRKIMWNEKRDGIPLTIIKSDGGFTYDTSDMAAIKQRIVEEKGERLIYVTDSGQSTHFQTVFACAIRAGIIDPKKHITDHVGFGVVLGEDGKKFKTRSGDTVKLIDLLDEGLKRSLDKLIEKERDKILTPDELKAAQESIAYGCIKYADLSHNRINEYVFSFDKMLEDKGNTAVYLLYAFTRIRSIARNCGGDYAHNIRKVIETTDIAVEHEREWKLAKILLKFPDIMLRVSKDLYIHHLCEYVYDVCTTFTDFYDVCYCIEKNKNGEIIKINAERILLCEATALIIGKCFDILGLKPVTKL